MRRRGRRHLLRRRWPRPPPTRTEVGALSDPGDVRPDRGRRSTGHDREGYSAWLDEPVRQAAGDRIALTGKPRSGDQGGRSQRRASAQDTGLRVILEAGASPGADQLRQRVAFALSEIFVISMADTNVEQQPARRRVLLRHAGQNAFGNYRDLLEAVTLHPMMGLYLSHLRNQKEDPRTGRVPDENFAREVMQLFSIGLVRAERRRHGATRRRRQRRSRPTRTTTSSAWRRCSPAGAGTAAARPRDRLLLHGLGQPRAIRDAADRRRTTGRCGLSAVPFDRARSASSARRSRPGPAPTRGDLRIALDALFKHPNVGPFIGRQLIQRLVTSNPSPAYVGARRGGVRQQRQRRARRHEGGRAGDPARPRGARHGAVDARATASCASRCCAWRLGCARSRRHAPQRALTGIDNTDDPVTRSARRRCARPRCSTSSVPAIRRPDSGVGAPAWSRRRCRSRARQCRSPDISNSSCEAVGSSAQRPNARRAAGFRAEIALATTRRAGRAHQPVADVGPDAVEPAQPDRGGGGGALASRRRSRTARVPHESGRDRYREARPREHRGVPDARVPRIT